MYFGHQELHTIKQAVLKTKINETLTPSQEACISKIEQKVDAILAPPMNSYERTGEEYSCMPVCTVHLSKSDKAALEALAQDDDVNMITGKATGWFVKLYQNNAHNCAYPGMSEEFNRILTNVHQSGYRMVEFDNGIPEEECRSLLGC